MTSLRPPWTADAVMAGLCGFFQEIAGVELVLPNGQNRPPQIDDPPPLTRRDTYALWLRPQSASHCSPGGRVFDRSDYTSPGRRPRSIHGNVTFPASTRRRSKTCRDPFAASSMTAQSRCSSTSLPPLTAQTGTTRMREMLLHRASPVLLSGEPDRPRRFFGIRLIVPLAAAHDTEEARPRHGIQVNAHLS